MLGPCRYHHHPDRIYATSTQKLRPPPNGIVIEIQYVYNSYPYSEFYAVGAMFHLTAIVQGSWAAFSGRARKNSTVPNVIPLTQEDCNHG